MNPPNNGPASLPVLSIPNIQLISRPRSLVAAPCEIAASRPMTHICAAQPVKKRRTNSSGNEWANTTRKAVAEVSSGPAIITGRRPKRSINQPARRDRAGQIPEQKRRHDATGNTKADLERLRQSRHRRQRDAGTQRQHERRQIRREERLPRDRRVSPWHARDRRFVTAVAWLAVGVAHPRPHTRRHHSFAPPSRWCESVSAVTRRRPSYSGAAPRPAEAVLRETLLTWIWRIETTRNELALLGITGDSRCLLYTS